MQKAVADTQTSLTDLWFGNKNKKAKRGRPKKAASAGNSATTGDSSAVTSSNYSFESVNGMSLEKLFPAPSKQKELSNNMILSMTEEEYIAKSIYTPSNTGTGSSTGIESEQARIIPNEAKGVFRF